MNRKFAALAAAIAVVFVAFGAQAAETKSRQVDPRIGAVSIGVGAASTAAYFSLNDWYFKHWNSARHGVTSLGAWGLTMVGCAAISPMVATAVLKRPLTYREAHILIGSCVIPVVGGWLVNEAYNAHVLWAPDEKSEPKKRHKQAKM
jgi:hypothetical protein